ncbi:MAG TPA: tetratricopeptide repeat protein, partial [Pyrinomonadaceae bacterium]|nr:tetratricopeptide repeat protein [Pyrinomonadaceae bacterium]
KLRAFIDAHPDSALKPVATEFLVSAHAALGDEKLQAGDAEGGVAQFSEAIAQSPAKMTDALFLKVVSQIPANLYLRGQRSTSIEAAHLIEAKVKDDPKRLLALAGFFLGIEEADEAARLSEAAIALAPDLADAHQALGAARHIALRLDDAALEYARALELDPKLMQARRSLADLRRASGKAEDALNLYREQLAADPADRSARAGVVLSLLDLGKKEEAEREMEAALKEDEKNLPLLVGASYWYAAHNEAERAGELATKAIGIEPRYTWAHIALARSFIARRSPLDAERVLRFARTYGRFPTLDYELASALAASGLYEEAAEELSRSFTIKDGQIETRLAGRTPSRAASFIELLAPERRAGIFQPTAADTEANARNLKGLLELTSALNSGEGKGNVDAALLGSAQQDFLAGEDSMRTFRQLYAASRLLRRGVALPEVIEISEAASGGVEAALDAPVATLAVMADELRDARSRAIVAGQIPDIPVVPRNILSNIVRGRIEDLTAWSLFNQDKTAEALTHLKRALSVLPENSPWWRTAQWHMGATLEATGNQRDALAAYLKSYNPAQPDPVRRAIIETLYRKVNGSLDGLNEKIGPA